MALDVVSRTWRKFTRRRIWVRTLVQAFFFALIALIAVNHSLSEKGLAPAIPFVANASLHAVCPFGGVVSLYQLAVYGSLVQKIHDSSMVLMVIVFAMSVLFGPLFCGWVCPLGSLQEWLGGAGRRLLGRRRYNHLIPARIDRWLRYLRYLVLVWVLYVTAAAGTLIFAEFDPYFAMFNFWSGEVALSGLVILGITLAGSLLVERPWCKYACPYGALLGISNLLRVFRIRRVPGTCKLDGACDITCPMNIKVSEQIIIRDHQCISCLECTSEARCPAASTVEFVSIGARQP